MAAPNTLDDYLAQDPYFQNISDEDTAKYLGFFTQLQQHAGLPWHPYKPAEGDQPRQAVSDIEAYKRLASGQPIELEPKRVVNLNLSATQFQGLAALTSPISGAATVAANAANANLGTKGITRESNAGPPVIIPDKAHLKLLYELHSGEQPTGQTGPLAAAAHDLSYFTATAKSTNYPWSFHETNRSLGTVLKNSLKSMLKEGWMVGVGLGVAGLLLGGPIGSLLGFKLAAVHAMLVGAELGAAAGAAGGGIHALMRTLKTKNGSEMDEFQALDHLLHDKPVAFQEQRVSTFELPFYGAASWKTDYGEPNIVHDPKELSFFSKMENQINPTPPPPAAH